MVEKDRSNEVMRNFRALGLDALIAIGGDGTLGIAERFARKGMKIVGVPKTIDNDIPATVVTLGFDTAVTPPPTPSTSCTRPRRRTSE